LEYKESNANAAYLISNTSRASIRYIAWQECQADPIVTSRSITSPDISDTPKSCLYLAERFGMDDLQDSTSAPEKDEISVLEGFFSSETMFTLSENSIILALAFGIHPLFSVNISLFDVNKSMIPLMISSPVDSFAFYPSSASLTEVLTCNVAVSVKCADVAIQRYFYQQRSAQLVSLIQAETAKLTEMIVSAGKKWKDATKPIIPKMSLLMDTLKGYELEFSPIEFMYTIAICGNWHPAAQSSIPTHWNEQGILRLKTAIDTSSLWIIKMLSLRALPLCTNIILQCRLDISRLQRLLTTQLLYRELLGLCQKLYNSNDGKNSPEKLDFLSGLSLSVSTAENLILKIDETLNEAKMARESMLLFIKVLKLSFFHFVFIFHAAVH